MLVVLISEIAKRSSVLAAVLASIPLVSVLAMIWLYLETRSTETVATFSTGVFWLVLPSLVLFIALPLLLRRGVGFYPGLAVSLGLTVLAYLGMIEGLRRLGAKT